MGTLSFNLPLPVLNGAGAAVDCSTIGAPRTITCIGELAGAVIGIEISDDGGVTYGPLYAFNGKAGEVVIPVVAQWMRATVSGRGSKPWLTFSVNVDVGGPDSGSTFAGLPMPVLNGAGAAVDVSAMEPFTTMLCTGAFAGCSVAIQISEDNIDYASVVAFGGTGGLKSQMINASWMRTFVSGREAGQPFSAAASVGSATLGGGVLDGVLVEDEGNPVVTTKTLNFVGAGVTATDVAGVGTITIPGAGASTVFQWLVGVTWATIYAAMAAVPGPKILLVQYDPAGPRVMTAGAGAYDLNEVLFFGTSSVSQQNGEGTTIAVDDGVTFADAPVTGGTNRCSVQSQWLSWDFTALTGPAYTAAAGDRATWTQLGGQFAGSGAAVVFDGTLAMSLTNVQVTSGQVMTTSLSTSVIEAQANSSFFGSSWITTAGNSIAIFTDASCNWSLAQFVAGGWVEAGAVVVNNFALGTANQLYAISVDGGGAVIATLAP